MRTATIIKIILNGFNQMLMVKTPSEWSRHNEQGNKKWYKIVITC